MTAKTKKRLMFLAASGLLLVLAAGLAIRLLLDSAAARRALEAQASAALGHEVRIARTRASLWPRIGVTLDGVELDQPPRVELERVEVSTGLKGLLARRVEQAELRVKGARIELPIPAGKPGPPGSRSTTPGFTIASVRSIRFDAIEVRAGGASLRLDLAARIEGDRLIVERAVGRGEPGEFEARATLESWRRAQGTLEVDLKRANLDRLLGWFAGLTPPARRDDPAFAGRLSGTLRAADGVYSGLRFRGFSSSLLVDGPQVKLDKMSLRMYGGSYAGSLQFDLHPDAPRLEYRGVLRGVDVKPLLRDLDLTGNPPDGRLDARIDLRARGADSRALMASARGTAQVELKDGRIPGLDLLHTALAALGAAAPDQGGTAFTSLLAHVAFAGGVTRTEDLRVRAPDLDLRGRGSLGFPQGAIDVRAELLLTAQATARLGGGALDYAKEDGRLVLPARIGGTLDAPSATLDAEAVARRAAGRAAEKAGRSLLEKVFRPGR